MNLDRENEAIIFDIQGFSVHDGPGSRTLVFFKGCPLRCFWCSNPEGFETKPNIMYKRTNCTRCYECITRQICPSDAISFKNLGDYTERDRSLCAECEDLPCAEECYHDAIGIVGKKYTVDELVKRVDRDARYWGPTGGVTCGGGEVAMQWKFATKFLKRCKENYWHTAIESSSFAKWESLRQMYQYVDFAFNDIKHMDPEMHKKGTGVDNKIILDNIKNVAELASEGKLRQILRIPIIVGYNDTPENIDMTIAFLKDINANEVNLLAYHALGESKYEQLDLDYPGKDLKAPSEEHLEEIKNTMTKAGLNCYIGSTTPF